MRHDVDVDHVCGQWDWLIAPPSRLLAEQGESAHVVRLVRDHLEYGLSEELEAVELAQLLCFEIPSRYRTFATPRGALRSVGLVDRRLGGLANGSMAARAVLDRQPNADRLLAPRLGQPGDPHASDSEERIAALVRRSAAALRPPSRASSTGFGYCGSVHP